MRRFEVGGRYAGYWFGRVYTVVRRSGTRVAIRREGARDVAWADVDPDTYTDVDAGERVEAIHWGSDDILADPVD